MAIELQSSNLEIRQLAVAVSPLLMSGVGFLAAQSPVEVESKPCGKTT